MSDLFKLNEITQNGIQFNRNVVCIHNFLGYKHTDGFQMYNPNVIRKNRCYNA